MQQFISLGCLYYRRLPESIHLLRQVTHKKLTNYNRYLRIKKKEITNTREGEKV